MTEDIDPEDGRAGRRVEPVGTPASVLDAFVSIDEDWRYAYLSQRGREVVGRRDDDPVGERAGELLPGFDDATLERKLETAMTEREPVAVETYHPELEARVEVRALPSETGLSVYVRDVTDRRRYEERLEALNEASRRLMAAESEMAVARVTVEVAERVLDQPLAAMWSYDAEMDRLVPLSSTASRGDSVDPSPAAVGVIGSDTTEMALFRAGEPTVIEDYGKVERPADPEADLGTLLVVPLGERGLLNVGSRTVESFDDVTRKLVATLGWNAGAALERVAREDALRRERRVVRRQNQRLDQFASIVSHDLRTPLSVATGRLDLARESVENDHLDAVDEALDRMDALVDDVLSLAREGRSVDDATRLDLREIAVNCWGAVEASTATLAIEDDLDAVSLRGDPKRVRRLLENLFRNAVEHATGAVTVTVGGLDGGFYVADDGPGIPEDERESIFDAGYTTSEAGTGFGLMIVEAIVDAHDWAVEVAESADDGARFEIVAAGDE